MKRRLFVRTVGAATGGILAARSDPGFAETPPSTRPAGSDPSAAVRTVTIEAVPSPIGIDTTRTAVLVVDMQNDFGSEGGAFQRAGIDISMIRAAVAPSTRAIAAARTAGIKVVYLKMGFRPNLSDAGAIDSPNYVRHRSLGLGDAMKAPDGTESRILIRDTWNTDIVAELTPRPGDVVIYKHRFSGFFETPLDETLRRSGIRHLIVIGCTTSICVESTIRDAMFRDYSCVLLKDCAGEPIGHGLPRSNHEASLLTIQTLLGWVSTSADFTKGLTGGSRVSATSPG
jgi:ureidoacrylate peracid hydrolase